MKHALNIIGIFLAVATLMVAGVGAWNHFPSHQEKRWRAESDVLTSEIVAAGNNFKELTVLMKAAFQQHDDASWLKGKAMGDKLNSKMNELLAQQKEATEGFEYLQNRRHTIQTLCLWIAPPLAIFTLLSFILAAVSPARPS
ncbi:MAG: hypothetical protein WDM80_14510 [Limisphaerales bacterium]